MKWPLAHDVDSTPFSRWQRTQRFCTTLTESRLQHFTRRPCSRVRRGPLSLDSGPRAGAQGQSVSPPYPVIPAHEPESRGGRGTGTPSPQPPRHCFNLPPPLNAAHTRAILAIGEGLTPPATSHFPLMGEG